MKAFKTIALLLVGTVSSLLLMGCGEIDTGTKTSAWEKETATIVLEEPKTEIILGDIGGASTLQEAIADFNSKNDRITITIHDYYEENINDGISRLYDDILTGKGPDIISFSTDETDVEALREKGAIENLIPYLEKSDVIGEEDIVDSAYQVLTADGGLYMLPTNFVLYTLITKEKWCSNKENFTFEEALRSVRECEEDPMISRDLFLQEGAICGGYFGETEDNRLEQYIKIAEQLPQQAMFQTNDLLMREGKIPFNLECIGDMQQYLYKKSVWGEDAVYTGFPGAEGKGRIFIFDNCFAINSQSTHKEEAWKFVESYFTEEGQKTIAPNWNFSILQDVLDQQLSDSRKQEYYQTSDGKREKLPILTYEIGGTYENVYAAQDEDIQDVREMINNTKVMQRSDLPFIRITQEEALYYFNGEKSIEETVAAIRNKIDEMPNATNATNAQTDMDVVINIGDFSVSLYESEQEILGKLDKMGLLYEKVEDSDNKKYDYYNIGDGEAQFIQVYFLEKECVRIRISSNETFALTSRGIYSGNTYSQMVDQYGDSYEKHTYMGKERYTIYRYALGECFHEFGIPGEATGEIYNVDVYVSGQMPIYDYGEEIVED
ncbi:extracellular solute-binding protein [Firmicutes bacterium AF22-6AC]|nr:extracellular solute-binding protein [Firmicutes bacterium AF22-6AC]